MYYVKRKKWSDIWQKYRVVDVPKGLSAVHTSGEMKLVIYKGGDLIKVSGLKTEGLGAPTENLKRGIIQDFSRESRRRLQRFLASMDRDVVGLPTFITVTYPGEWQHDWKEWKRHLDNLNRAFRYHYPKCFGVWRLEFQKRGAPHFHFLVWNGPKLQDVLEVYSQKLQRTVWIGNPSNKENQKLYEWLSRTWYKIVGSGDKRHLAAGTRIEPVQSWNGVVYYTSKYLAKLPDGNYAPQQEQDEQGFDIPGTGYAGRYWGIINKSLFPIEKYEFPLTEEQFRKIKRPLIRKLEKQLGKAITVYPDEGITAYLGNEEALKLLYWALGENYDPDIEQAPF